MNKCININNNLINNQHLSQGQNLKDNNKIKLSQLLQNN